MPFPPGVNAIAFSMRTTFRIILITVLVAGVVGSIGAGAASWYLTRKIGPDFWVALIEDNTNCRAEVKAVHLTGAARAT